MKRLILIIAIAMASLPLFADVGVRLGTATGMQGDTVEVSLFADGTLTGQNIFSYQFQVAYNQSRVELIDVANGSALAAAPSSVWNIHTESSTYYVSITNAFGNALTGTGELIKMKFRLVSSGSTTLTFNGNATNNYFNEGQPAMTFTNGSISITALPVISVNIPSNTSPMAIGSTVNLSASGGVAPYTWEVSDAAMASVNASGQLTATGIGTVSAIATDSRGYGGTSAAIEIRGFRLSINDTTFLQNQYVDIPVVFQNLTNKPVFSGELSVDYNPNILNFDSLIVENQIIGGYGNAFNSNVSAPNSSTQRLTIGFANSSGFTVSGNLAIVRFRIANAASGSTGMNFTAVQFNDNEQAIVRNGTFRITALPPLTIAPNNASFQNYAGETRQLTVSGGTAPYAWTSSNPLVASVDGNGLVSVLKGGAATIRVSDVWGAYKTTAFQTFDTRIKVADTVGLVVHRIFRLPVELTLPVSAERKFTALQGKIVCNAPQIANISIAVDSSLTANFATAQNSTDSVCTFAISGTQPITQAGVLFYAVIEFNETVRQEDSFNISLSDIILNEGSPNAVIEGGTLTVNVQQGITAGEESSNSETGGTISVNLDMETTMTFTGTITLSLPEGFTLDEDNTLFNPNLANLISLAITDLGNNTWLFTFTMKAPESASSKSEMRSVSTTAELAPYANILNIAYLVDSGVPDGVYQAILKNILLTFEDDSQVNESEIPITITKSGVVTGIGNVGKSALFATPSTGGILVNGLVAGEQFNVYNMSGQTVYSGKAHNAAEPVKLGAKGVYIIKSEKGVIKVIY